MFLANQEVTILLYRMLSTIKSAFFSLEKFKMCFYTKVALEVYTTSLGKWCVFIKFLQSLFTIITRILELFVFFVLDPIINSLNLECLLEPITIKSTSIFWACFFIPLNKLFNLIKYATVMSLEKKYFQILRFLLLFLLDITWLMGG